MQRTRNQYRPRGNILTNDPSIAAWGWAVMDWKGNVIEVGCIKTEPEAKKRKLRESDDFIRRIGIITHNLMVIIASYDVNYLLSELPHGSQNARAAKMIGAVAGVIQTISSFKGMSIEWFSENDVKKHLFGRKSVTKEEMINKVVGLVQWIRWPDEKYKREAIADALGVYLTACDLSPTIKFLRQ